MIAGGCFCGACRYEISAEARTTLLCHCEDCRRASGAPVVAWTFFPAGSLLWKSGTPRTVLLANRERAFCPGCGSPLLFYDPAIPEEYEVTTCSLDLPQDFPPEGDEWLHERLPWFQISAP